MTKFQIMGVLDVFDEEMLKDPDSKEWFKTLLKSALGGLILHSNEVGGGIGEFETIELVYELVEIK
jgi:hypothetical protein